MATVLGTLFAGGVGSTVDAIGNVFDKLFTSDEERAQAQAVLEKLRQHPGELQVELNKIEAAHRTVFVAGWRPFIGWICGFALAWHFMLYDLLIWVQTNFAQDTTVVPQLTGTEALITVVLSLLGLGGLRTLEKVKGISK